MTTSLEPGCLLADALIQRDEALIQRDEALERLATLGEWLSEKGFDVEDEIDLAIKLLAQFLCQSEQEAT